MYTHTHINEYTRALAYALARINVRAHTWMNTLRIHIYTRR